MSQGVIPKEVKRFIIEHINSVFQLEVLLLLHDNKELEFCAEDVERELGIDPEAAQRQLTDLHARGLLTRVEAHGLRYRYDPNSEQLDMAVSGLAKAYHARRFNVLSLILSKPVDKVRLFAEAFRIRRD